MDLLAYAEFVAKHVNGRWHAYVAEHGIDRTAADVVPVAEFAGWGVEMGERGLCYLNAANAALDSIELVYVQGIAGATTSMCIPMEHAWLETEDGRVIDPTWGEDGANYRGVAIGDVALTGALKRGEVWGHVDDELIEELKAYGEAA